MSNSADPPPTSVRRRAPVPREICPLALAAETLGDRWTLLILREAFYGVQRYDDMRADLHAPRSMLTDRLTKLVASGLMARQPYREPGSRTRDAYVLTPAGRALAPTLLALTEWGEAHVTHRLAPVEAVDGATGAPVQVALVTAQGEPVETDRVRLRLRG